MRNKKHPILYYTPAIGWGILVLYLSLTPGNELPRVLVDMNDKFLHVLIYFFSGLLVYLALIQYKFSNVLSRIKMVFILVICTLFGGSIELMQAYWVPNRAGDWYDFAANTSGAVLSIIVVRLVHRQLKKQKGA